MKWPSWPFVVETGHGKRAAFVDLATASGCDQLASLVREADIFTGGYRPGSPANAFKKSCRRTATALASCP